ncbi:hypothetical protein TYRP_012985, partial [Tyrophagus putrescentiae]
MLIFPLQFARAETRNGHANQLVVVVVVVVDFLKYLVSEFQKTSSRKRWKLLKENGSSRNLVASQPDEVQRTDMVKMSTK